MDKCSICKNTNGNNIIYVKEMMFGFRDRFRYLECTKCKCLQLIDYPKDMGRYYPSTYYSYNRKNSMIKRYIQKSRNNYFHNKIGIMGKILLKVLGDTEYISLLGKFSLTKKNKILDVGCGEGRLLKAMSDIGFTNLIGIDPFLEKDYNYGPGLKIYNKSIFQLDENRYDFIMMHHSFEHMHNPLSVLQRVRDLLEPKGLLLIRIPVLDGKVWEIYRENWVQIDAPRHLYIYSQKSLEFLANQVDLKLTMVYFDSHSFQFWGSEQYKKDIPLNSENSYLINPSKSIFDSKDIKRFSTLSNSLNLQNAGDQAGFVFERK